MLVALTLAVQGVPTKAQQHVLTEMHNIDVVLKAMLGDVKLERASALADYFSEMAALRSKTFGNFEGPIVLAALYEGKIEVVNIKNRRNIGENRIENKSRATNFKYQYFSPVFVGKRHNCFCFNIGCNSSISFGCAQRSMLV